MLRRPGTIDVSATLLCTCCSAGADAFNNTRVRPLGFVAGDAALLLLFVFCLSAFTSAVVRERRPPFDSVSFADAVCVTAFVWDRRGCALLLVLLLPGLVFDRLVFGLRVEATDNRAGLTFGVDFGVARVLFDRLGLWLTDRRPEPDGLSFNAVVLFAAGAIFFKCSTRRVGLFI